MPDKPAPSTAISVIVEDEPRIWEQQDGETERAFDAFKGFLFQMSPRRVIHASARASTSELYSWCREWRWQDRAKAYDRHTQRIRDEERECLLRNDEKDRMAKMLTVLEGAGEVINREMTKLLRDCMRSEMFGTVKVADLNKLMGTWITMQRLIHGESTENVAINADLGRLTVDELRELQKLQTKLSGEADEEEEATH